MILIQLLQHLISGFNVSTFFDCEDRVSVDALDAPDVNASEAWKQVENGMDVTLTCIVDSAQRQRLRFQKYILTTKLSLFLKLPGLMKEVFKYLHQMKSQLEILSLEKS